ncbi:MAG: hypothetical protein A2150_05700 [Candidatus Muproteobacteria bacterium RBG_16_64_11]|uniref:Uncharacterized protein n=1 Tax=Candidatus Muproteobacteria bacterium RBG_16_64_11 TaxID=1817758 RepID=A0A1F6TDQ4_9PROT|nr:MAG: hypothetical protein A2150_05700 [Candidatus Muproteobacteria bacterium RBG_16_64_11]
MGIYHKDCPRCATTVATYISRCECGFSFDGNEEADPAARLEALIEEERLYEEYLAARAKQAMAAAAQAEAAIFEESELCFESKSTEAEKAIATRDAVLAELNQQKLRTAEILAAIEAVKTGFRKVHVLKPHIHKSPELKPPEPAPVVAAKTVTKPRVAAPPVVLPPTAPAESPVVSEPPPAKIRGANAYTAKLEEILKGSKRTDVPESVAEAVPLLLPAPQPAMRTADNRPSPKDTDSGPIPKAVAPVAAIPPSSSPEEELERAAKAVRFRATEMATRHGLINAVVPPPAIPETSARTDHAAATGNKPPTHTFSAADPGDAARTADMASMVAAKPVPAKLAASAETGSPASPKEPAVSTDARQQMRAHHARTAKTQRTKRNQRAANTQVLTQAPLPPTQETAPPGPLISDRPSTAFRNAQAAKAEKIVQAAKVNKSTGPNRCPYCSATHPPETARCGCGFLFEESFELPELVLNAKERAELLEGARPIKPAKPHG